jgi:DEAD/DEAH box helicase domain-containing protein
LDTLELNNLKQKVISYRAGYTATERRNLEMKAKCGDVLILCCTNALELGIDIGSLGIVDSI